MINPAAGRALAPVMPLGSSEVTGLRTALLTAAGRSHSLL